ncbi:hypothetical protein F5Y15DRAFT_413767 [Xylariaceae sp. FL0016]|nr:hypothetical protein F5Y15DRAFT_413767 [Xylariaceae sp. FL0016]
MDLILPTEVLLHVAWHFVQPPWVLACGFSDINFEDNKDLRTLRSLCLVSKKLNVVATTVLYNTVNIGREDVDGYQRNTRDIASLIFLLRSLVENPGLRPLITHVSCAADLRTSNLGLLILYWEYWKATEEIRECLRKDLEASFSNADDAASIVLRTSGLFDPGRGISEPYNVTGESIFGAIVCLAHNLESLQLYCPSKPIRLGSSARHHSSIPRYTLLEKIITTSITNGATGRRPPLQSLSTLWLLPYRDLHLDFQNHSRQLGCHLQSVCNICPVFLGAPNLSSFHAKGLNALGWNQSLCKLRTFTAVDRSRFSSAALDVLFSSPGLTNLHLYEIDPEHWVGPPAEEDYLNSALARHCSQTLQRLSIVIATGRTNGDHRERMMPAFGPAAHLTCLADFTCLKELHIQLCALVGRATNVASPPVQIETKLPSSLTKLVLCDEGWPNEPSIYDYPDGSDELRTYVHKHRHEILDMLDRFAVNCKSRCPKLKSVYWERDMDTLDCFYPVAGEEGKVESDVCRQFQAVGVKFGWSNDWSRYVHGNEFIIPESTHNLI